MFCFAPRREHSVGGCRHWVAGETVLRVAGVKYLLNDGWNEYGDEGDVCDIKLDEWLK